MRVRSRSSRRHPPIQRSAIAFMRGVRMLPSTVRMPASARTASNAAVKFVRGPRIMNLTLIRLFAEVHEQVAGLLGGPLPGGMQGDPEDADSAGFGARPRPGTRPGGGQQARRGEGGG